MMKIFQLKWHIELKIIAVLLTLVPTLIIGLRFINVAENEVISNVNDEVRIDAEGMANEVNNFFVNSLEHQLLIKRTLENENLSGEEKVSLLVESVENIDHLISTALVFRENEDEFSIAVQANKEKVTNEEIDNQLFSEIINNNIFLIKDFNNGNTKIFEPNFIKKLDLWIATTISEVNIPSTPQGYLISVINVSELKKKLKLRPINRIGDIYIINKNGEYLFNNYPSEVNSQIVEDVLEILNSNARVTGVNTSEVNDEEYVYGFAFASNIDWAVITEISKTHAYLPVTKMNNILYFWLATILLIAIGIVILFTRRIRKPINKLEEKANQIAAGDFDIHVDYNNDDSIGKLGKTLVSMSGSLKDSFKKIEKQNIELEEYSRTLEDKVKVRTKELKETNEDLQQAYMQVLELNNEKNEFLGIAAHDLKNPLVAIKGFGNIIAEEDDLSPEELKEFAGSIVESSERMFEIITRLLDINRIEEGRIEVNYSKVDVTELILQVIHDYHETAAKKRISIQSKFCDNIESLETDRNLVHQIIDNFISNAIKFSKPNKEIILSASRINGFIKIGVKDQGPGLSEDDKKKLFKKFAKLSAQPTGGEHSTGLGLSIAKKITEMMGGEVGVESEHGNGAEFWVKLPV